jgi:hypothetical protein
LGEARGWPVRVAQSGFLDLAGFKKPSYYYRASLWNQEPMAYLSVISKKDEFYAGRRKWHAGDSHWNWDIGEQLEIICSTNCEEAELFLNDRSMGKKKLKDSPEYLLSWDVNYVEGMLRVVAKNTEGRECSYELQTVSRPKKLIVVADNMDLIADGQDTAHIEVQAVDEQGRLVYLADDEVKFSIEGPGHILGIENGDPQDLEPYCSKKRKLYHGRLLAYIRTDAIEGNIVVKAEAEGMEPAEAVLTTK